MSFRATHIFKDILLEEICRKLDRGAYRDSEGLAYILPLIEVYPAPQPGEVWSYYNPYMSKSELVLIAEDGKMFLAESSEAEPFFNALPRMTKVLNADGTSAL